MEKPFFRTFTKRIFIYSNFLVAILFLIGANVKYLSPERWWFFSLFTLALPYLLLALILFLLFWLIIKPVWISVSLITLFISIHAVKNIFPPNLPTGFTMEKQPENIRIMSWNVELFNILHYKIIRKSDNKCLILLINMIRISPVSRRWLREK